MGRCDAEENHQPGARLPESEHLLPSTRAEGDAVTRCNAAESDIRSPPASRPPCSGRSGSSSRVTHAFTLAWPTLHRQLLLSGTQLRQCSPVIRPSHITTIRWLMRKTSGNSDEIITIASLVARALAATCKSHSSRRRRCRASARQKQDIAIAIEPLGDHAAAREQANLLCRRKASGEANEPAGCATDCPLSAEEVMEESG